MKLVVYTISVIFVDNIEEIYFIIFSNGEHLTDVLIINIGLNLIQNVVDYKILGVTTDNISTFRSHVTKSLSKVSKYAALLYFIRIVNHLKHVCPTTVHLFICIQPTL